MSAEPMPEPLPGDGYEQSCRICRHVAWREEFRGGLCSKCRDLFKRKRRP